MSLKLEVGEYYLSVSGEIVKIDATYGKDMFEDTSGNIYEQDGYFFDGKESNDLIAHIPKALHYDIIKTIKAYHTYDITKQCIDNGYNNKD